MRATLVLLVLMFSGCRTVQPKVWEFPGLGITVIKVPEGQVPCQADEWDDGSEVYSDDVFGGCWHPDSKTVYVDERWPHILLHELCHADGTRTREECSNVGWDKE